MNSAILQTAGRDAGFTIMGEPLAVDLANTIKIAANPARELLPDEAANERFWQLEAPALPDGSSIPDLRSTLHLREALRGALAAVREGGVVDAAHIASLNETASRATVTPRLVSTPDGIEVHHEWSATTPAALALAAVARSALELMGGTQLSRLRECAAPSCSMLFVATNAKRVWCTSDVCGNRQRVARHARATSRA